MAGLRFGDVEMPLFVASAAFGGIDLRAVLGDSRSTTCCTFSLKMRHTKWAAEGGEK